MHGAEALALDPDVVIFKNEPAKYRSTTKKLYAIFNSYTDAMEPYTSTKRF
jgi:nucleotidyltransferase/DNA polymerase involved in DNA repair